MKRNGGIKSFKDMTVPELKVECAARGLHVDERLKRKELQQYLKDHLKGVQTVPALLINEQDKSLKTSTWGQKLFIVFVIFN